MTYFDTHAHFSRLDGEYRLDAQITRAREAGVSRIVAVGGSCELNQAGVTAATAYPDLIRVTIGQDRDQAARITDPQPLQDALDRIRTAARALPKQGVHICGIGEIGLDYHYDPETAPLQKVLFRKQLQLARELELPVVVHSRKADADTLNALADHARDWKGNPDRIGVLHCFTGSKAFAAELVQLGYYISFSGIVTFRNADPLRNVVHTIPDEKLLIETDAPYLAPTPMRGKRNEPAFVPYVATRLADIRNLSTDTIAKQTFANASRLFAWT